MKESPDELRALPPTLACRVVDRQLDRARVLAQARAGEIPLSSFLDATPSLIATAEVLGEPRDRLCPACHRKTLRMTRWIHGGWLGEKSGTARSVREINKVVDEFASALQGSPGGIADGAEAGLSIHFVEVCLSCKWNFLVRHELITSA